jgi:hypothetical protein
MMKMTLEGSMEVNMTKVKDLISGDIVLLQDTQDRMAALEHAGLDSELLEEYPTLFVQVGNAELLKIWGHKGLIPYLEDTVDLLWENKW